MRPAGGASRRATFMLALVGVAIAGALGYMALVDPRPPVTFRERVDAVASTLKCPVCENLSVADSPSEPARRMRATVASKLREGKSPQEIRAHFVSDFGESVLLSPKPEGVNLVVWAVPVVLAVGGCVAVLLVVRRWVRAGTREGPSPVGRETDGDEAVAGRTSLLQRTKR
jgi:cytochrome c-type biogenesis protein CcmH